MNEITHVTKVSINVFADLGCEDAENLKLRAQLMAEISRYVQESGLTQAEVAEQMKTTQPRLNDVLRGRIGKCTIDRLVNMLSMVGRHVSLRIEQAA